MPKLILKRTCFDTALLIILILTGRIHVPTLWSAHGSLGEEDGKARKQSEKEVIYLSSNFIYAVIY